MTGDTDTETQPDEHRPGGLHTLAHVILWATGGRRGHDLHDRTPELVPVRPSALHRLWESPAPVLLAWAVFAFVAWRGLR